MNYQEAGVDLDAADAFVETIKPLATSTHRLGTIGTIGGFAAVFDPKAAGYVDPLILTSTDGVGTKLLIAIETGCNESIGIDLVAMCVNDLVCHGAEPLSFLDYFSTGKLEHPEQEIRNGFAERLLTGIAEGCKQAGCVLAGGETAEMPGMYQAGHYDLAGFAMGAVERDRLLPQGVRKRDVLIGLASSGLHSNGFSLVRKIKQDKQLPWLTAFENQQPRNWLLNECMKPTKIYVKAILDLHRQGIVKAAAHITGGGIIGNLPRVLPDDLKAVFDTPWGIPHIFSWLRKEGEISVDEMLKTFNCGIGMILVVAPEHTQITMKTAIAHGHRPLFLGRLEARDEHHIILPEDRWWS